MTPLFLSCCFLIAKITLLMVTVLVLQVCLRRQSASQRHFLLVLGLIGIPLLVGVHFFAPAWSIPGSNLFLSEPPLDSAGFPTSLANRDLLESGSLDHTARFDAFSNDASSSNLSLQSVEEQLTRE